MYNWFDQNYREYSEFYRKYVDTTVEQFDDIGSDV